MVVKNGKVMSWIGLPVAVYFRQEGSWQPIDNLIIDEREFQDCNNYWTAGLLRIIDWFWLYILDLNAKDGQCAPPPDVTNAKYIPAETYSQRSEVEYECINSGYTNRGINNTKLVCGKLDSGESIWVGERIDCQLLTDTGVCAITVGLYFWVLIRKCFRRKSSNIKTWVRLVQLLRLRLSSLWMGFNT